MNFKAVVIPDDPWRKVKIAVLLVGLCLVAALVLSFIPRSGQAWDPLTRTPTFTPLPPEPTDTPVLPTATSRPTDPPPPTRTATLVPPTAVPTERERPHYNKTLTATPTFFLPYFEAECTPTATGCPWCDLVSTIAAAQATQAAAQSTMASRP